MRRLAAYTAIILLTLSGLILLWELRQALVLFVLSLATAAAFRPLIDFFVSRNLPRGLALGLAYALWIGFLGILIFFVGGPLIRDIQLATNDFMSAYNRIIADWPESASAFQSTVAGQLPAPEQLYEALTGERGAAAAEAIVGVASGFLETMSSLVIILILSLYWSADRIHFERLWLSLLPVRHRTRAGEVWRGIEAGVGAYIDSELVQSILAGLLLWLGYWSMGLKYPVLLAVAGAFAWLIPWLGAVLAVIPPLLAGLGVSSGLAALAAIYTLMVLFVMEVVIEPRFFPRQRYSSLLMVLVVIAFALAFGFVGVILAPPFAAALQIFGSHYARLRNLAPGKNGAPQYSADALRQLEEVKTRLAEVQALLGEGESSSAPETINLVQRLDRLVEETDLLLGEKT